MSPETATGLGDPRVRPAGGCSGTYRGGSGGRRADHLDLVEAQVVLDRGHLLLRLRVGHTRSAASGSGPVGGRALERADRCSARASAGPSGRPGGQVSTAGTAGLPQDEGAVALGQHLPAVHHPHARVALFDCDHVSFAHAGSAPVPARSSRPAARSRRVPWSPCESASSSPPPTSTSATPRPAREFAELIGKGGHTLVWGGSDAGLMKVVADGVRRRAGGCAGSPSTSSRTRCGPASTTWSSPGTSPSASGCCWRSATPSSSWWAARAHSTRPPRSWNSGSTASTDKPVVLLNTAGFYDGLKQQFRRMDAEGFLPAPPGRAGLLRGGAGGGAGVPGGERGDRVRAGGGSLPVPRTGRPFMIGQFPEGGPPPSA